MLEIFSIGSFLAGGLAFVEGERSLVPYALVSSLSER